MSLLPSDWLTSAWYATLTAFVAVNTLVYVVVSISKILPRMHPSTWWRSGKGASRRRETRSIYPQGSRAAWEAGPGADTIATT
ncbi:MAG TPA: hypothetical protein VF143_08800 [Candidatus Nanopelagicales bacterium]